MNAKTLWKDFKSSGKRHLLLTGSLSSGKSYIFEQMIQDLSITCLRTKAIYKGDIHPACVEAYMEEKTYKIACYDDEKKRMCVQISIFEYEAVNFIEACNTTWLGIDEIGYFEKDALRYQKAIVKSMQHHPLLAVIRKNKRTKFIDTLLKQEDVFIFDMDTIRYPIPCVCLCDDYNHMTDIESMLTQIPYDMFHHVYCVTHHKEVIKLCERYPITILTSYSDKDSEHKEVYMCMSSKYPNRKIESIRKLILHAQQAPNDILCLGYQGQCIDPIILPPVSNNQFTKHIVEVSCKMEIKDTAELHEEGEQV